jgi:hypothetical protein
MTSSLVASLGRIRRPGTPAQKNPQRRSIILFAKVLFGLIE